MRAAWHRVLPTDAARTPPPQSGGSFKNLLACQHRMPHDFLRDRGKITAYVESRRRTEPDLGERFDGVIRHLEAPAGAGTPGHRLSELSSLHNHLLEIHLRATADTMRQGPFYSYQIEVVYPPQILSMQNQLARALAQAAIRQQ